MSVGNTETTSGQVLSQYLLDWDFREVHSRRIEAPASEVRDEVSRRRLSARPPPALGRPGRQRLRRSRAMWVVWISSVPA